MVDNPTVLVIEDYSDTRMLLSSFLRAHGFRVIEARDGKEGFIQANIAFALARDDMRGPVFEMLQEFVRSHERQEEAA